MRMKQVYIFVFFSFLLTHFVACVPPEYGRGTYEGVTVDYSDKQIQQILTLQQRQSVDSLLIFLGHENPTYRYLAARAFGALKDKKGIDSLVKHLKDEFLDVRIATAHALGQIGDARVESALMASYEALDTMGAFTTFNATVMEAVGKCGTGRFLNDLCNITTFRMSDTTLLEGQAYGIYRYGLRDTFSDVSIKKMMRMATTPQYPNPVRVIAANYLARLKTRYDTTVTNPIAQSLSRESKSDVRMALVKALGKAYNPAFVLPTFESVIRRDADFRVKINAVNGLSEFEYAKIQPLLLLALRDRNEHVSNTAAQFLVSKGKEIDGRLYKMLAYDGSIAPSTRQVLMGAGLRWLSFYPKVRDSLNLSVKNAYQSATNPYEKARLLRGLAEFGLNYDILRQEALNKNNAPIVRTVAAEGVAKIASAPDFFRTFRGNSIGIKRVLKATLFELIKTGDAGISTVASDGLRRPEAQFNIKLMKDSVSTLYRVMQSLKLPNDLEAYESLRETINWISDTTAVAKRKVTTPKSIDWSLLSQQLPTSAIVKTNKGEIKMQLLTQNAPISVANFVSLARGGFFNGKIFHRVVPNFVAQTGCPRGDGYGSLDFTITSELTPMHYNTEGVVGMASAGNHTECSQWFITHSPTPHLDTNYSIFAKVIEGMAIAQDLIIGDVIESVVIN